MLIKQLNFWDRLLVGAVIRISNQEWECSYAKLKLTNMTFSLGKYLEITYWA